MAEDKKQNIWIKIAGHSIPLAVDREEEASYREAEQTVNMLVSRWASRFSNATDEEVLARVAFQFAKLYLKEHRLNEDVYKYLSKFEADLDDIVVNV